MFQILSTSFMRNIFEMEKENSEFFVGIFTNKKTLVLLAHFGVSVVVLKLQDFYKFSYFSKEISVKM